VATTSQAITRERNMDREISRENCRRASPSGGSEGWSGGVSPGFRPHELEAPPSAVVDAQGQTVVQRRAGGGYSSP